MAWEISLIQTLQNISNKFLDVFFLTVTALGDEIVFMLVAVVLYWCVNKRYAFQFANVYFLSVASNEFLKGVIKRTRPYNCEGIRSIGEKTSGYSFPSGHSQSISNISTQLSMRYGKKHSWVIAVTATITALVMLSRIYLGQHYLTDTLMGAALGVGLAFLFSKIFQLLGEKEERIAIIIAPLCTVFLIVLVAIKGVNAAPNILKVLGGYTAFTLGYYFEKKFIKYEPNKSKPLFIFFKLLIGLAVTLALKEGLKFILPQSIGLLYNYLRYFLVAAWASIGAMSVFKALKI